jgi:Protein of unknown function (DUF3078)
MKKICTRLMLISITLIGISSKGLAQDLVPVKDTTSNWAKYWKYNFDAGINVNQAAFSDSWKGGGVNSISASAYIFGDLTYNKNKVTVFNSIKAMYGTVLTFNRNANNKQVGNLRKSQDYLDVLSKADYQFAKMWRVFGQVNFLTQFDKGYDYTGVDAGGRDIKNKISGPMAPGYLTESVGIEFKPAKWFYINVGLLSMRQTFVLDTTLYVAVPSNYGVTIGDKFKNQFGFSIEAALDKDLHKNINLKFKYRAFKDYTDYGTLSGEMVHRMEVLFSAKITKYIVTSLSAVALYDATQDKRVQWSQGLNLGVAYKIYGNKFQKR